MNLSKTFSILGASALLVGTQGVTAADPTYDMNVIVAGYKNKEKFLNALWKQLKKDFTPDAEAKLAFETACAQGQITIMGPDIHSVKPSDMDLTDAEVADFDKKVADGTITETNYKKVMGQILDHVKYENKLYWVSTPEQGKKSDCTNDKAFKLLGTQTPPEFKGLTKVILGVRADLGDKEFGECVATTATDKKITGPVCTTIDTKTSTTEQKAIVNGCYLCSVNNGMVASAVGAAALVALALFF